jgi:hypothetical protein
MDRYKDYNPANRKSVALLGRRGVVEVTSFVTLRPRMLIQINIWHAT